MLMSRNSGFEERTPHRHEVNQKLDLEIQEKILTGKEK
jgi:hypothetical protein